MMGINKMLQAGAAQETSRIAEAEEQRTIRQEVETAGGRKNGRPPVPEEQRRKQYTITLPEEKHAAAIAAAQREGLSFARLVEKALDNYI